jgi:hypothetical protein
VYNRKAPYSNHESGLFLFGGEKAVQERISNIEQGITIAEVSHSKFLNPCSIFCGSGGNNDY